MNKKISLGAAIAMMAIIAAITFSITMVYSRRTFNNKVLNIKERESTYSKLSEIDKWTRQNFYGDIDNDQLMDAISTGYIGGLDDPYAKYYTVEAFAQYVQSGTAKSVGVGIVAEVQTSGYLLVKEVYPDSPALAAGIQAGDLIVKIDETELTPDLGKEKGDELLKTIQGEAGTKVDIVTRRDNVDTPHSLTRRDVEKPSIYAGMVANGIGYVQIIEFNSNTSDQFGRAVDKLVTDGARGLVFDVRNNQNGTAESTYRILDKLLPQCVIASATYKDGSTKVLASSDPAFINLPMVVLTNEKTASAAELFTQALKDINATKSVGVTTIGKGTMQVIQQLNDGSAIDITIAKYNSPKGQSFDGIGVKPDFEVKMSKELSETIAGMDKNSPEKIVTALELDPQLKKAVDLATAAANVPDASSNQSSELANSVPADNSTTQGKE